MSKLFHFIGRVVAIVCSQFGPLSCGGGGGGGLTGSCL